MVRDGKGGKDRRVMLPQSLKPRRLEQAREALRCLKRGIENWTVLPPDKDGRVRLFTRSVTATWRTSGTRRSTSLPFRLDSCRFVVGARHSECDGYLGCVLVV
jgi:hypothetical protein